MNGEWNWRTLNLAALAAFVAGAIVCAFGAAVDLDGFTRAWLCAFLFWLGLPICGVTLVLVHDLTGGRWMASARPALNAAIATMPLAALAGIPAFIRIGALYRWVHPSHGLSNAFYLNSTGFYLRYAIDVVLWCAIAAFALWGPRGAAAPIAPARSWISAVGLIALALSASFASIDWILSLEPTFWSSIFPLIIGAGWFNTGLALVLLVVAAAGAERDHMADIAAILLGVVIFWTYVEFMQFLIIWEENLKTEIPWYLSRLSGVWRPTVLVGLALGFFAPFFVLVARPGKRSRIAVAIACVAVLASRLADSWWLVLPEFSPGGSFWLDAAAILALGGLMLLLFFAGLRSQGLAAPAAALARDHG